MANIIGRERASERERERGRESTQVISEGIDSEDVCVVTFRIISRAGCYIDWLSEADIRVSAVCNIQVSASLISQLSIPMPNAKLSCAVLGDTRLAWLFVSMPQASKSLSSTNLS